MSNEELTVDQFVRSIEVNKNSPHAIFLGAGASLSSGVPSANRCVQEWKRSIFATNNPTVADLVAEVTLPSVMNTIDRWLRDNGHWPSEDEDDYGYFIESCLPIAEDRRRFFEPWINDACPHIGYQLLALLAKAEVVRSVWTTNFDGLVAKAVSTTPGIAAIEVGLDTQSRLDRQISRTELLCVALHGDYRYDLLSNTEDELRKQDEQLRTKLIETLSDHSLIVLGYSGRDQSVMKALSEAISYNAPTKLYWCGFSESPDPPVANLLERATESGHQAFYIPGADFDDVLMRLASTCLADSSDVKKILGSSSNSKFPHRAAFDVTKDTATGMIKSNALPLRCPSEMYSFELKKWPETKRWKWVTSQASEHGAIAVPFRKHIVAFGTLDDLQSAFEGNIDGTIKRVPIDQKDYRWEDAPVTNLLQSGATQAIAAALDLQTDGKRLLWESTQYKTQRFSGSSFPVHRSLSISLRPVGDRLYLTLDPTYYIPDSAGEDTRHEMRKYLLGYQHNADFNEDLEYWRKRLCKEGHEVSFDFPPSTASFTFSLDTRPAFATTSSQGNQITVADAHKPLIHHHGFVSEEPKLLFATTGGWSPSTDTMPLRGLTSNGPFDSALSQSLGDKLRLSVVCPKPESGILEQFLTGVNSKWEPKWAKEYLVPYPGFEQAFRIPIDIPKRTDTRWFTLPEIDVSLNEREGALQLSRNIRDAIQAATSSSQSVVLVLTPERWDRWRRFKSDDELFDVHHFVKAHAVQRGIATQFLKQEKLNTEDLCRFWWWFSLAIYAKSMRTPWVLEGLDSDTAYVGLGYALEQTPNRNGRVILGCSHLYNAHGQGLQFRLSRIENPTIRGDNPYMSFDDARRMGEVIRTLFWNSHQRLPRRVVIHKLFPFLPDEQKGLLVGLDDIPELDLLEINHESKLRYLSSGKYPVRRGTCLKLTDHEALAWVHGSTDAVISNWTYFQGKRRIPSPVVIRRHAGHSSLGTVVAEILGLSKMDWNSGELYSQLPATVKSSKAIAQIGSLLQRFGPDSFDYRLFM